MRLVKNEEILPVNNSRYFHLKRKHFTNLGPKSHPLDRHTARPDIDMQAVIKYLSYKMFGGNVFVQM